jgi:hypothetical protein
MARIVSPSGVVLGHNAGVGPAGANEESGIALAASRGEPWAEVIDLGVIWDTGAPEPHIVSDGSKVILLCYAAESTPGWYAPESQRSSGELNELLIEITFTRCWSFKFGSPNDETLHAHPLYGRGLQFYAAHKVYNSSWVAEIEALQASHDRYVGPGSVTADHYVLAFHDDTFEAIADAVDVKLVEGTMRDLIGTAAQSLVTAGGR